MSVNFCIKVSQFFLPATISAYKVYQGLFYLWQMAPLLKNCKVPKYYYHVFLKIFVLISTLSLLYDDSVF